MYRINIKNSGKYGNCVPGYRYCLTWHRTKKFLKILYELEIETTVERFGHCGDGVFCWSDITYEDECWGLIYCEE